MPSLPRIEIAVTLKSVSAPVKLTGRLRVPDMDLAGLDCSISYEKDLAYIHLSKIAPSRAVEMNAKPAIEETEDALQP
jgi:hypothetical protein